MSLGLGLKLPVLAGNANMGGNIQPSARYYTNFIASRSSYSKLDSTVSVGGAFKIRVDVQRNDSGNMDIIGQSASLSSRFGFVSNTLFIRVGGVIVQTVGTVSLSADIREFEVELDGNDFIFRIDQVEFETITNATAAGNTFEFDVIGQSNSGRYYEGYIADLHVEENSIAIANFAMDESFAEAEFVNSVDPLNNATKFNISADQVIEVLL
jgi:hypothetical protein